VNFSGNALRGGGHGSSGGWRLWDVAVTPWLWDRARESFYSVRAGDPEGPPRGPEARFPDFSRRAQPVPNVQRPAYSWRTAERFRGDWRGLRDLSLVAQGIDCSTPQPDDHAAVNRLLAALDRVDLDRPLLPYPHQVPFVTAEQLERARAAQTGRQWAGTGALSAAVAGHGHASGAGGDDPGSTDEKLAPLRWLAQLAANIVEG
jgi:hypothetical protein